MKTHRLKGFQQIKHKCDKCDYKFNFLPTGGRKFWEDY